MTFEQIWSQLAKKDGALNRGESLIEFRADNLKQLLRQVYEQGEKAGVASVPQPPNGTNPVNDIFSMFW